MSAITTDVDPAYGWLADNTEVTPTGQLVCRLESLSREVRIEYGIFFRFFGNFPRAILESTAPVKVLTRVAVLSDNGFDTGYRVNVVEYVSTQPHITQHT